MWKYVKPYFFYAVAAAVLLVLEILMDLYQPELMSRIVDEGVLGVHSGGQRNMSLVWRLGALMLAYTLIGSLCAACNNVCISYASQKIGNAMRKDCFKRIMAFSFSQVKGFGAGTLITRMTNDITQVQGLISQLLRGMVRTSMLTLGSIYFMFRLHTAFGCMALGAFPLILGVIVLCLWRANPLFPKLQAQLDELNDLMQEDVAGVRIIKSCVREAYEKLRFGQANHRLVSTQLRILFIFAVMNPSVHMVLDLTIAFLLLWGDSQVRVGAMTPGLIMAALTYITTMMHGILILVMVFQTITRGLASWERVRELLLVDPELSEGEWNDGPGPRGKIEFKNVSFTYPDGENPVLRNVSLTINPGEVVAIMGATGCGKSTLVSLIPRFYEACSGQVLVSGRDVREYRQRSLREMVAFVLQKAELFSDTIRANVMWGQEGTSEERLHEAAEIAQAAEFIDEKEHKWDTVLAERGNSLSGGQKQRLAIARALLRDADILVFDDATSALDIKTEARLARALKSAKSNVTKVFVAQRVVSARWADRIAVLDGGELVGCGTHNELMESCPAYRDIYYSQIGGDKDAV
ncbi:ABC transporter ATP-binding protein [bacterium]|nr:ABC transporter ATP-binding protein [bacterium]